MSIDVDASTDEGEPDKDLDLDQSPESKEDHQEPEVKDDNNNSSAAQVKPVPDFHFTSHYNDSTPFSLRNRFQTRKELRGMVPPRMTRKVQVFRMILRTSHLLQNSQDWTCQR